MNGSGPATLLRRPHKIGARLAVVALFVGTSTPGPLDGTEGGYLLRGAGPATFRVSDAALLLSGQSGGAISTAVTSAIHPSGEELFRVIVATEVDSQRIQATGTERPITLEAFVYALRDDGEVVSRASQSLILDPARLGRRSEAIALKFVTTLDLPPGTYQVRSLVTQTGTDRFGLGNANLSIPGESAGSVHLSSPWLVDSGDAWTVITPAEGLEGASASIHLFDDEGKLRLLAAHPIVSVGSLMTGALLAFNLTAESGSLSAQFLRADGMVITEVPIRILQQSDTNRTRVDKVVFDVEIPALPPATYGLAITHPTPEQMAIRTATARFTVAEPELAKTFNLWTQMDSEPTPISLPRAGRRPESSEPGRKDRKVAVDQGEILSAYHDVFRRLAQGLPVAARAGLLEFEIDALQSRSPAAISDLEKKESKALSALATDPSVSLLPIAVVYAEMIGEYHRRGLAPLSEHALKMSTQMTDPITRKSRIGLDKEVAANVLVSVAGYAILASRTSVGEELLTAALKLAPQHEAALLSLAASREQHGLYREATGALERLVEAYPSHREGRLRLAVNLERLRQIDEALVLYKDLEEAGSRDWVELVAVQQMASVFTEQDLLDQAVALLNSAIERWPNEPTLRIQLAWVMDQSSRLETAGEMVEGLLTTYGSANESARYRYNHWYSYVFDESRQTLADLVQRQAEEYDHAHPSNGTSRDR